VLQGEQDRHQRSEAVANKDHLFARAAGAQDVASHLRPQVGGGEVAVRVPEGIAAPVHEVDAVERPLGETEAGDVHGGAGAEKLGEGPVHIVP